MFFMGFGKYGLAEKVNGFGKMSVASARPKISNTKLFWFLNNDHQPIKTRFAMSSEWCFPNQQSHLQFDQ